MRSNPIKKPTDGLPVGFAGSALLRRSYIGVPVKDARVFM